MVVEIITGILDKIPTIIAGARGLIMKLLSTLNLPEQSTSKIIFLVLAFFLGYIYLKQWVVNSMFFKLSTLLNWILISVLLYILIAYV